MRLAVSSHAVDRYIERVKPHLGRSQARTELEALVALVKPCERPTWWAEPRKQGDLYLALGPGVVGAAKGRLLTTVLAAPRATGGQRTAERKRRRELRRWKKKNEKTLPHFRREAA